MNLQKYKECINELDDRKLRTLAQAIDDAKQVIILGNGGSNGISSHISQDYTKKLGKRSLCFDSAARMSCYANDYGWENAYMMFLEHFAEEGTLVILISSSGNSANILNAAEYCRAHGLATVLMSGFSAGNALRFNWKPYAVVDFYVNSDDYGIVESVHEVILHSVI